jgi:hypothetical protein
MTVTLRFKPKVEPGLMTEAQAIRMSVEEYGLSVVEGAVPRRLHGAPLAHGEENAYEEPRTANPASALRLVVRAACCGLIVDCVRMPSEPPARI